MNTNKYKLVIATIILISFLRLSDGRKANKSTKISTDIPIPMADDILTILINGTVHLVGNCTQDVDASLVQYWLYTQTNLDGELITDVEVIDSSKAVLILIHGWGGYKNVTYIVPIKDAYLERYDAQVIVVDYGPYANSNYQSAYCDAPYVANSIVNFICKLKSDAQVDISSIHMVGHSLGGQISGMVGSRVKNTCDETIGRITGLDPAGPLYEGISPNYRLDKTDAAFVDVIHTNQGQYGYIGQLGHVDFYPNGGMIQPGCLSVLTNLTALANFTVDTLISFPLSVVTCNHQRSCYLFAESITMNSFYSTSVLQCFGFCLPDLLSPSHCYMGENLREPPPSDNQFTCSTNAVPKYGLGPDGPLT